MPKEQELTIDSLFNAERIRHENCQRLFGLREAEVLDDFLYKAKEFLISIPNNQSKKRTEFNEKDYDAKSARISRYIENRTEKGFPEDYIFEVGDKIWTYFDHHPVPIDYQHYPFFFFLRICQYSENIFKLQTFLTEHQQSNYKKSVRQYIHFINDILLNYDQLIPIKIKTSLKNFIDKIEVPQKQTMETDNVVVENDHSLVIHPKETMAYRAAVYYYLIKDFGMDFRDENSLVNMTHVAKHLHLLFNKKFKTIQNSEFYKIIGAAPNFYKRPNENINLLNSLKDDFASMKLDRIVRNIEADIEEVKAKNKKKSKNGGTL